MIGSIVTLRSLHDTVRPVFKDQKTCWQLATFVAPQLSPPAGMSGVDALAAQVVFIATLEIDDLTVLELDDPGCQ